MSFQLNQLVNKLIFLKCLCGVSVIKQGEKMRIIDMIIHSNLQYDIVVIGKGIAGLSAALEASQTSASVAIVYDSAINSTIIAYEGVFRDANKLDDLQERVQEKGYGLTKTDVLDSFITQCHEVGHDLEDMFPLDPAPPVGKRHKFGGKGIVRDLEKLCIDNHVQFIEGKVFHIGTSDGKISNIQLYTDSILMTIMTKCVILAAGGGLGTLFSKTDNYTGSYCTPGCILALNAGAQLRDIEYISFHPCGKIGYTTPHKTIPIVTFLYSIKEEMKLYSCDTGDRMEEIEALVASGDATSWIGKIGAQVYRNKGIFIEKRGKKIKVYPVAHSLIGGVDVDSTLQTSVKGLYAVGEITGGLHGASRLPGMSLLECFVFGKFAGKNAVLYAAQRDYLSVNQNALFPRDTKLGIFSETIPSIKETLDEAVSVERTERVLFEAHEKIMGMMSDIKKTTITQQIEYDIAEMGLAIIKASQLRQESRGMFLRADYLHESHSMSKSILVTKQHRTSSIEVNWEK